MTATDVLSDPEVDPWLKNAISKLLTTDPNHAMWLTVTLYETLLGELDTTEFGREDIRLYRWKKHD